MSDLPETILQFGGGNFLRAFVDLFAEQANRAGQAVGRIVVVQSTASGVAETINRQAGRYHVLVRGLHDGKPVDAEEEVRSVSRALAAASQWEEVLRCATSPALRYVVSNTTEAGFALDAADAQRPARGVAPVSFPAKLLDVLWTRFDAGLTGPLTMLPCELLPKNGVRLRSLVVEQAGRWHAPAELFTWLSDGCVWVNSLVDRIVSGKPASHPLLSSDALLTVAEPYALWAVESQPGLRLLEHPAIELVDDTAAYELRKIRILNGAHTALVAHAMPMGIQTVRQAVQDERVGPWLRALLDEEIIPTIDARVPDARGFAATTLERFANPFLDHKLSAIALNHSAKVQTRLAPTRDEFIARFDRQPKLLNELLGRS